MDINNFKDNLADDGKNMKSKDSIAEYKRLFESASKGADDGRYLNKKRDSWKDGGE